MSGNSVLLLHGLGSLNSNWENEWKSELSKGARVIVPQYPNPFPRDLRIVARWILDGIRSPTPSLSIVGHSMGGMIAIEVLKEALNRGIHVQCVVLVATAGQAMQHSVLTDAVSILDRDVQSNPPFDNPARTLQQLLDLTTSYPEVSRLAQSQAVQTFLDQSPESMRVGLEQLRAAVVWMSSSLTLTQGYPTSPTKPPRIVVVVPGLDDVFLLSPPNLVRTLRETLRPMEITDVIMLDNTSHHAEQIFTGSDAAEFILGCGSMSVLSRTRLALRFLALQIPGGFGALALAALFAAAVVLLLLQKRGRGTRFTPARG